MPLTDAIRQRVRPLTAALTSNRIMLYALFSTSAMLAAIANACRNQSNFYSVTVYLSRSGRSLLILANFAFLAALVAGKVMQRIFFGPLQPREVERLYDQTWMFVTESLLAFTIFRDEFDIPFVLMFGFLLFVKCFHWLMADRVESMDQATYPGPPLLFHIRTNALFYTVIIIDASMFLFAVESTMANGVGGMVLFATEYAILMASAVNAVARYTLNYIDYRRARSRGGENAPPWDNKSMFVFYIELATDFLKLTTYLTFFMIILTYYGLPLNIIRDVYLTARSFITRLRALIRYHNATRDMDRRYPNATEEELSAMSDRTCIICREELTAPVANVQPGPNEQVQQHQDGPNMNPKKLPCGHVFHFQCLRSWLERQQSCPTCRRTVLEPTQPNRNGAPPQQPQANGLRPVAPPQPGAAPQPPQQGQQLPGGGVGGWLGRFLGIAAQPQLIPGGFPHGFMPPPPPGGPGMPAPPPAQGQLPAQPIPGYGAWPNYPPPPQYQPGYLYPPGYQPYPYPPYYPPPMYPQLPPNAQVLRGFYGPGGVYYPWPADQGAGAAQDQRGSGLQQATQQPVPGPARGATPATGPTPFGHHTPTPTVPAESAAPQSNASSSSSPSSSSVSSSSAESSDQGQVDGSEDRSTTPREAAALAALRRFNTLPRASPSMNGSIFRPAAPAPAPATESTSGSPIAGPSNTSAQSTPQPAPTPNPTRPAARNPEVRQDVPSLIPLYEFGNQPPFRAQGGGGGFSSFNYRSPPAYGRPPVQPPTRPIGHGDPIPNYSFVTPRAPQARRPPLHQLPATLTDEQLGRLDRLTREAIDERLRVLENVSGAVYRCIDELMRARSALPVVALAQNGNEGASSGVASGSGGINATSAPVASGSTAVETSGEKVESVVGGTEGSVDPIHTSHESLTSTASSILPVEDPSQASSSNTAGTITGDVGTPSL